MQKGRRACLPAGKGRVGGAGAVNRLQRGVVQAADVRGHFDKACSHAALHRGILGQNKAAAGHAVSVQQIQQIAAVVAAVGGGGL